MRARGRFVCLLLFCGLCLASAQESPSPQQAYTIEVTTQLVLVDASVQLRKTGETLKGLTAADFVLTEDGVPQTISSVSEDQLPLSLVLLFDLTDTVHPVLIHLSGGAAAVLRHLRPQDEVAVMTFSSGAKLLERFTRDHMTAVEAIDDASASYDRSEPTFLFEDLWEASEHSASTALPDARRVQIWITDGSANDQDSDCHLAQHAPAQLHNEAEATAALLRSEAVVSALIERGPQPLSTGRYGAIERFAALTGGPVVQATAADIDGRMGALLDTLRQRYTLGYRPSVSRPEGSLCRLAVTLSPAFFAGHPRLRPRDVLLHARASYLRQRTR